MRARRTRRPRAAQRLDGPGPGRRAATALACGLALGWSFAAAAPVTAAPASDLDAERASEASAGAFRILQPRLLTPTFLDGAPSCLSSLAPVAAAETHAPVSDFEELAAFARRARPDDVRVLREQVQHRLDRAVNPLIKACLRIESARVQLRVGFGPEALAELQRAERALDPARWLPSMRDTARYYRSEARILMGAPDEETRNEMAQDFDALAASAYRSVAAAARLRAIDLSLRERLETLDEASAGPLWKELRELLETGRELQLDVDSWAPLAAELAIRAGHWTEAHHWLAIAEGKPAARDLAAIRKADVLMQLERPDEARVTLRRVMSTGHSRRARSLAALQIARDGLVTRGSDERVELLERAARSKHPIVSLLALERLARERLDRGDVDGALTELRNLAHADRDALVAPLYPPTLDRALDAAIDGAECPRVLGRLASTWDFYLRASTRDEVFARIGDCYLEMGMGDDALQVFRGMVRRFGAASVADVAWHVARSSFDAGDLPSSRAALRAHSQAAGNGTAIRSEDDARWQWLTARLAQMEGRDAEAEALWLALAESTQLPPDLRGLVEFELIRAWKPGADDRFENAIRASLDEPAWVAPGTRAHLRVQLADRIWQVGRRAEARAIYRDALPDVDTQAARARANYRAALAAGSNDSVREALLEAGNRDTRAPWSRLARTERRMMDLRQAVGRTAQVDP